MVMQLDIVHAVLFHYLMAKVFFCTYIVANGYHALSSNCILQAITTHYCKAVNVAKCVLEMTSEHCF
jgi:hypothetical protein